METISTESRTSDTAPPVAGPTPGRDLLTVAAVAAAVACFAVHVALLVVTGTSMLAMVASMLVLSGACVACTWNARRTHQRRDHLVAAALALTMITLHLLLTQSGTGLDHGTGHASMDHASMDHSSMGGTGTGEGVAGTGLMTIGVALAALQMVLALALAALPARRSAQ